MTFSKQEQISHKIIFNIYFNNTLLKFRVQYNVKTVHYSDILKTESRVCVRYFPHAHLFSPPVGPSSSPSN